jgi:hypothetical protein
MGSVALSSRCIKLDAASADSMKPGQRRQKGRPDCLLSPQDTAPHGSGPGWPCGDAFQRLQVIPTRWIWVPRRTMLPPPRQATAGQRPACSCRGEARARRLVTKVPGDHAPHLGLVTAAQADAGPLPLPASLPHVPKGRRPLPTRKRSPVPGLMPPGYGGRSSRLAPKPAPRE